jgi:GNAT superfamily N-acetyltransferase
MAIDGTGRAAVVEVRKALPTEEPGRTLISQLELDIAERYAADGVENAAKEGVDLSLGELVAPRGAFFVAVDGETGVGCGGIRRHEPGTAEIKRMYVIREARGRGVARAVLQTIEAAAIELGYRRLVLATGTRQPEAMRLYATSGYDLTPNFGFYADSPLCRCFGKELVT